MSWSAASWTTAWCRRPVLRTPSPPSHSLRAEQTAACAAASRVSVATISSLGADIACRHMVRRGAVAAVVPWCRGAVVPWCRGLCTETRGPRAESKVGRNTWRGGGRAASAAGLLVGHKLLFRCLFWNFLWNFPRERAALRCRCAANQVPQEGCRVRPQWRCVR